MKVGSMFAGIGGIDLGFKSAGFEITWANDNDSDAVKTYKHNFGKDNILEKDIRNVNAKDIPDIDILTAGFPCQPFSVMGKQKGFNDVRGNLFFEITRVIEEKRPKIVFLENVRNLISHDNGRTFLIILNNLTQLGYNVKYKVMNACEYGNIPQDRSRIFIVAFLDHDVMDKFIFPDPIRLTESVNSLIDRSFKQDDKYYYKF